MKGFPIVLFVILLCIGLLCLLSAYPFGTEIRLDEYAPGEDFISDLRLLIGKRVVLSLVENCGSMGVGLHFSFHPDLGKLVLVYMAPASDEFTPEIAAVLILNVSYRSCEELVFRPTWSGILTEVYEGDVLVHGFIGTSFLSDGELDRLNMKPEEIPGDCYGSYYQDPSHPDRFYREGKVLFTSKYLCAGLFLVSKEYGVPWGFQKMYDAYQIEGLANPN